MSEEERAQESESPAEPESAPVAEMSAKEVEEGKTFAILSYALSLLGLPFFLVPLIMRNNDFSLYHSKQCLLLWIAGVAVSVVGTVLLAVCIGALIWPAGAIFLLVLDIMGLVNAVNGRSQPVPVIGKFADDWFKGITKV